jgi:hypothetical protein
MRQLQMPRKGIYAIEEQLKEIKAEMTVSRMQSSKVVCSKCKPIK